MAGTYLLLIMVLLAARIPALERVAGQDRMIRWHRRLSSAPLVLLGAHVVLTTLGFAQADRHGFFGEAGTLIMTMGWIFAAVVSYAMLVAIAGVSIRAVRRRMNYDTWWIIHLYTYLALAFSVPPRFRRHTVRRPFLRQSCLDRPLASHGRRGHRLTAWDCQLFEASATAYE